MPATYEPIATHTLASDTASYEFTSIPGTFTDLVLVQADVTTTGSNTTYMQFNGDTAGNYSRTWLFGDGSTAQSAQTSNDTTGFNVGGNVANSHKILHIMSYANTNVNKTVLGWSQSLVSGNPSVVRLVGLWRDTSAITSVKLESGGTFKTGATFSLYGIKAA